MELLKKLIVILIGTASAQLILLLSYPLLTQLYSPERFGEYAVFISIITILGAAGSFKFDIKFQQIKKMHVLTNYISTSVVVSCVICTSVFLFIVMVNLFYEFIAFSYLFLCFIGILSVFFQQVIISIYIRLSNYKQLGLTRMFVVLSLVLAQCFLFYFNTFNGLILSHLVSLIILTFILNRYMSYKYAFIKVTKLFSFFRINKKYPMYIMPASVLNVASINLLPIILALFVSPAAVGLFSVAQKISAAPVTLLCQSLSQVFFSEGGKMMRDGKSINKLFFQVLLKAFCLVTLPLFIFSFYTEFVVNFIFGEQWAGAAIYLKYLLFVSCAQSLVNPVSTVLFLYSKEKVMLFLDLSRLLLIIISLLLPFLLLNMEHLWLEFYTIASIFSYFIYFMYYMYLLYFNVKNEKCLIERS